uniref:Uncharacterized protein n=1 Tax=Anguilla anguilla TaxID=7936 RepID=A0A0E9RPJ4_ANGAN
MNAVTDVNGLNTSETAVCNRHETAHGEQKIPILKIERECSHPVHFHSSSLHLSQMTLPYFPL